MLNDCVLHLFWQSLSTIYIQKNIQITNNWLLLMAWNNFFNYVHNNFGENTKIDLEHQKCKTISFCALIFLII